MKCDCVRSVTSPVCPRILGGSVCLPLRATGGANGRRAETALYSADLGLIPPVKWEMQPGILSQQPTTNLIVFI